MQAALKKFEGIGRLVRDEEHGKETALTDAQKTRTMTIEENRFVFWEKGKVLWAGTIKVVDGKSDPVKIDATTTIRNDGTKPGDVGLFIWRVKGKTLYSAGAHPNNPRPTDFPSAKGSAWSYQQWKLVTD